MYCSIGCNDVIITQPVFTQVTCPEVTYGAGCISNCSIGCNDVIITVFLSLQPVQKAPMELVVSVTVV